MLIRRGLSPYLVGVFALLLLSCRNLVSHGANIYVVLFASSLTVQFTHCVKITKEPFSLHRGKTPSLSRVLNCLSTSGGHRFHLDGIGRGLYNSGKLVIPEGMDPAPPFYQRVFVRRSVFECFYTSVTLARQHYTQPEAQWPGRWTRWRVSLFAT